MEYSPEAYRARLEALFARSPSVQDKGFSSDSYKPGLEGMSRFDACLGHPWRTFRSVHVAGTNGKGSVCSMIAASAAASGLRTGLFTSPHMLDFRERIKVVSSASSIMIGEREVWDFLETFGSAMEGLSFFEITTGMALWWFGRQKVDLAVIEVGLGGRLDSTNIILPALSVVTSIGLDHCALLGNTRALIASEKAGIFKRSVPALVGFTDPETEPVFRRIAEEVSCPLTFLPEIRLKAADSYQVRNRATACKALEMLGLTPCLEAMDKMAVITGLHGRWEKVSDSPEVIADIGHNPPALALNFARLESSGRPLVIVYGIMADKDLESIAAMMPSRARYFLCAPDIPRALPVAELKSRLAGMRPELDLRLCDSVRDAVLAAVDYASSIKDTNPLVYVGGSNFVVAEAIQRVDFLK